MACIGVLLRLLALLVMYKISNPKIVDLQPPLPYGEVENPGKAGEPHAASGSKAAMI